MTFYDSAATYDSGLTYDSVVLPTPHKKMSKIKLNLKSKTDSALVTFGQQHIAAMTGNANFPAPVPPAPAFLAIANAFSADLLAAVAAQQTAKQKTATKDASRAAYEAALTQRANTMQGMPGITDAQMLTSGFDLQGASAVATMPDTVMNLFITAGDNAGELDMQWDPEPGANRYEMQLAADAMFTTGVISLPSVTKSQAAATGLTSGTRMWARVRALNAAGVGAWSDVATKIVP